MELPAEAIGARWHASSRSPADPLESPRRLDRDQRSCHGVEESAGAPGQSPAGRGHRHPHRTPSRSTTTSPSSSGRATSRPWSRRGGRSSRCPPADDCPDGVFVEDAVVMFRNVAVITRPGAESRQAGGPRVSRRRSRSSAAPSTGSDLREHSTVATCSRSATPSTSGSGGRTNADGLRQLRSHPRAARRHRDRRPGAAPQGPAPQVGGNRAPGRHGHRLPATGRRPGFFPRFMAVPEESGAHVVDLGGNKILMAADCPESAAMFADLGYEPVTVDISEFQKLEGCVTCLSVRLRELSRAVDHDPRRPLRGRAAPSGGAAPSGERALEAHTRQHRRASSSTT